MPSSPSAGQPDSPPGSVWQVAREVEDHMQKIIVNRVTGKAVPFDEIDIIVRRQPWEVPGLEPWGGNRGASWQPWSKQRRGFPIAGDRVQGPVQHHEAPAGRRPLHWEVTRTESQPLRRRRGQAGPEKAKRRRPTPEESDQRQRTVAGRTATGRGEQKGYSPICIFTCALCINVMHLSISRI